MLGKNTNKVFPYICAICGKETYLPIRYSDIARYDTTTDCKLLCIDKGYQTNCTHCLSMYLYPPHKMLSKNKRMRLIVALRRKCGSIEYDEKLHHGLVETVCQYCGKKRYRFQIFYDEKYWDGPSCMLCARIMRAMKNNTKMNKLLIKGGIINGFRESKRFRQELLF